jgi:hypothetical protein
MPDNTTSWGLSVLLSLMDRLAVREPVEAGLKVRPMLQLLPAATLVPQGVACVNVKSPGSLPVKVIAVTLRADAPVFVRTTVCTALVVLISLLPKSRLEGTSSTVPVETAMVALSNLELSEIEVAVSVTGPLAGTDAGAV